MTSNPRIFGSLLIPSRSARAGVAGALLTSLVLIAGVALTSLAWLVTSAAEEKAARAELQMHATDIQTAIQDRLLAYQGLLRAGAGFIHADASVSPRQWEVFVDHLSLAAVYPGIQGVGFSARVNGPEDVARWSRGLATFGLSERIQPTFSEQEITTAIVMLEPRDQRNLRAIGFDMWSEAVRREAMARARDEGDAALSGRVTLLQEIDRKHLQPGFLMYLPVYAGGAIPDSVEERRRTLLGFVYAPFRAGDFFSNTLSHPPGDVVFEVFDRTDLDHGLLYRSGPRSRQQKLFDVRKLHVAGHEWTLRVWAGAPLLSGPPRAAQVVAVSGGAITLLLAAVVATLGLSRQHLQQRVLERTAQLENANRELLAANRDLEAFTYTVSHDLRAPLRAAHGHLERFITSGHALSDAQEHHANAIRRNIARMAQMIEDLLDLSVVSRRPLELQRIALRDVLAPVIEDLRSMQPIEVDVQSDALGDVEVDPDLLRQALTNLLSNAAKFSRNHPTPRIWVGVEHIQGERAFYVRDNGVGFDMQHAGKLFGVFERLHQAREFEGLGVGLAIVKQIIERHGGRIWAHSEPGKGATFWFTLSERGQ